MKTIKQVLLEMGCSGGTIHAQQDPNFKRKKGLEEEGEPTDDQPDQPAYQDHLAAAIVQIMKDVVAGTLDPDAGEQKIMALFDLSCDGNDDEPTPTKESLGQRKRWSPGVEALMEDCRRRARESARETSPAEFSARVRGRANQMSAKEFSAALR